MTFLVDTNTFSEPMKPEPNRKVLSLLTSRQFDCGTSATAREADRKDKALFARCYRTHPGVAE